MMETFYFPRKALAAAIADAIVGSSKSYLPKTGLAPQPASGTFLSAQRRQGKTSFLVNDLKPELEAKGLLVIYIDLWADLEADPQELLYGAIDLAQSQAGAPSGWIGKALSKSAKAVDSVGIPGIASIKLKSASGTWRRATLAQTFAEVSAHREANKSLSEKRMVLIVDEAQQALATESGTSMMFALKAARDALNLGPPEPKLFLIFTGSDRSKLASLLATKNQPFYGATIRDFPVLGPEYCAAVAAHFNMLLRQGMGLSTDAIEGAFSALNYKPESLMDAIGDTLQLAQASKVGEEGAPSMNALLEAIVKETRSGAFRALTDTFHSLTPLQQAVFLGILRGGQAFAPFSEDARMEYSKTLGQEKIVSAANAQNGLSALVAQGLLWKPLRGGYQVDDSIWMEWAERETKPPTTERQQK